MGAVGIYGGDGDRPTASLPPNSAPEFRGAAP